MERSRNGVRGCILGVTSLRLHSLEPSPLAASKTKTTFLFGVSRLLFLTEFPHLLLLSNAYSRSLTSSWLFYITPPSAHTFYSICLYRPLSILDQKLSNPETIMSSIQVEVATQSTPGPHQPPMSRSNSKPKGILKNAPAPTPAIPAVPPTPSNPQQYVMLPPIAVNLIECILCV